MWSNQTETGNKNMTSLKSKITHRKRKNSKTKSSTAQSTENNSNSNTTPTAPNKKPQNARHRNNSTGGGSGGVKKNRTPPNPDLLEDVKQNAYEKEGREIELDQTSNEADVTHLTNGSENRRGSLSADVRSPGDETEPRNVDFETLNNNNKRYSDSFVIGNHVGDSAKVKARPSEESGGTRGELFAADSEIESKVDKVERKTRRFSDIFRYGALKPSASCENIKTNAKMISKRDSCLDYRDEQFPGVPLRRKPLPDEDDRQKGDSGVAEPKKGKKGVARSDSKSVRGEEKGKVKKVSIEIKPKKDEPSGESHNDSYLKRVKSKIYKNRSDTGNNGGHGGMPNIAENEKPNKKSKKKKGQKQGAPAEPNFAVPELRKAVSQFDFRLIRQTSNLERIRPKTFGLRTSTSNLGIAELMDNPLNNTLSGAIPEKPVLAKSKSSSAINLNLLRTRRNKLLDQAKKNCKIVQNEFDFIAFGAVRSAGLQVSRKFGSSNLNNSISCDLDVKSGAAIGAGKDLYVFSWFNRK